MRIEPLVLLIAVATTMTACRKQTAEEVESETPVAVKTATAARGDIRGVVHATGVVSPAPGAELVVVAPEPARIVEIPHAAGDRVRRGDLLVRFEIPGALADVQKQQAEVTRAQTTLENAKVAQTRARDLFERGVAARREVEDSTRAVADAEAAVSEARASLAAAEAVAGRATVRATFDGVIAKREHNPGDLVEASAGDPVLRVIDPHRLEFVASVPLADALRIAVGAPGQLVNAPIDTREIRLRVLSLPAAVDTGTATVPVRLSIAGPASFPVGTPMQVDIDAEQHRGVVLIPSVALVREGEETAVFIVGVGAAAGKAQRRPVQVGLTDGTQVEIVSGVAPGDAVIVEGQAGLPNDAPITIADEKGAAKEAAPGSGPAKEPK